MEDEKEELITQEQTPVPAPSKQRHGCITAWLYLLIVANAAVSMLYIFFGDLLLANMSAEMSKNTILLLAVLAIFNVSFAVMLLRWRKIGFWGFVLTSLIAFGINISVGIGASQSVMGLVSVGLLYGILQLKNENKTAWEDLE